MKKSRRNLYIALEELDLVFDESEVIRLQEMWKENKGILEIAALIMDQADKNKIKSRPMGLEA
ncbi:hypothetical protein BF38_6126 (plasmid) [Bacillus thuringiensis]|nr:hypothetical protein BF38_6126 [Bacillus thuringiensis]